MSKDMNNNQQLSPNKMKKAAIMAEISDKILKAKALVFTNYQGLSHKQIEEFKKEIKKLQAEFAVTKNTLLKRTLSEAKIQTDNHEHFDLPTGTLFMYGDVVAPLKILSKMIKTLEKPLIKFGFFEGKIFTGPEVIKLSTLPSREILLAQLLGQLTGPIAGLNRALNWNIQKFVMTLNAIEKKKNQ